MQKLRQLNYLQHFRKFANSGYSTGMILIKKHERKTQTARVMLHDTARNKLKLLRRNRKKSPSKLAHALNFRYIQILKIVKIDEFVLNSSQGKAM